MSLILNVPEPGQLVDVRQRRYVVVDVAQGTVPSELLKPALSQHLVSLASVEDDDLGEDVAAQTAERVEADDRGGSGETQHGAGKF